MKIRGASLDVIFSGPGYLRMTFAIRLSCPCSLPSKPEFLNFRSVSLSLPQLYLTFIVECPTCFAYYPGCRVMLSFLFDLHRFNSEWSALYFLLSSLLYILLHFTVWRQSWKTKKGGVGITRSFLFKISLHTETKE
jgi:hypothetical protein